MSEGTITIDNKEYKITYFFDPISEEHSHVITNLELKHLDTFNIHEKKFHVYCENTIYKVVSNYMRKYY